MELSDLEIAILKNPKEVLKELLLLTTFKLHFIVLVIMGFGESIKFALLVLVVLVILRNFAPFDQ